jgi:hypothetical protein
MPAARSSLRGWALGIGCSVLGAQMAFAAGGIGVLQEVTPGERNAAPAVQPAAVQPAAMQPLTMQSVSAGGAASGANAPGAAPARVAAQQVSSESTEGASAGDGSEETAGAAATAPVTSAPAVSPPTGAGSATADAQAAIVSLKVARAIDLYAAGDASAADEFREVLRISPRQPAALWFLGLISLDAGLQARGEVDAATDDTLREELKQKGRAAFEEARRYLGTLLEVDQSSEPMRQVRPIEAGLTLAIAQLADDRRALELTHDAITTLEEYDRHLTQRGTPDYLAKFFLGIAHWRLGTYGKDATARDRAEAYFRETEQLLDRIQGATTSAPSAGEDPRSQEYSAIRLYVQYYRGIAALSVRDRSKGIELLGNVVTEAANFPRLSELRENALALIELAQQTAQGPTPITLNAGPLGPLEFRGGFGLSTAYDSNVILLGDDTAPPRRIPNEDDYFGEVGASAELTRRFTKDDGFNAGESLTIGIGADTTHRWHPSIKEFDINQYRARAFVTWEPIPDIFVYGEYQYSWTLLGHEPFIGANSGFIGLTKRWSDPERESYGTRTDVYYGYEWRDYKDRYRDFRINRDGEYQLIGFRQSFDLWRADELWPEYYADAPEREKKLDARRFANVFIGYEYREERTKGSEFDLGGHTALGGIEFPLPYRLAIAYQLRASWDNYSGRSLFDFTRDERFDFRQTHGLSLSYILVGRGECEQLPTLEMRLRGFLEYTVQDSNVSDRLSQDVYSYDRGQYGVALQVNF